MIANKLVESFYVLQLEGGAVDAVLPGDFGIQRISIGSLVFPSDLHAHTALNQSIRFIADNVLGATTAQPSMELNPEFFPIEVPAVSDEQLLKQLTLEEQEQMMSENLKENQIALLIPKTFDDLGNFIESKYSLTSKTFKVTGKIAVDPDEYIKHLTFEKIEKRDMLSKARPSDNILTVH